MILCNYYSTDQCIHYNTLIKGLIHLRKCLWHMLVTSFNLAQAVKPFKMNVAGVALPYEMASAVVRTLAFHINSLRLAKAASSKIFRSTMNRRRKKQPSKQSRATVDVSEILHTSWGIGSLSHYLQGFIHPRWLFGISEPSTVWRSEAEHKVHSNEPEDRSSCDTGMGDEELCPCVPFSRRNPWMEKQRPQEAATMKDHRKSC